MNELPHRALIAAGFLAFVASALPAYVFLQTAPAQMSLRDRMAMVRTDLLSRPCFGDEDCRLRVASFGVDPTYYEGPDEWLESGCQAKRDRTACAYLAAWREVETAHAPLVGYGCEGSARPLYGDAEDEFPACAVIERVAR